MLQSSSTPSFERKQLSFILKISKSYTFGMKTERWGRKVRTSSNWNEYDQSDLKIKFVYILFWLHHAIFGLVVFTPPLRNPIIIENLIYWSSRRRKINEKPSNYYYKLMRTKIAKINKKNMTIPRFCRFSFIIRHLLIYIQSTLKQQKMSVNLI